MLFFYIFTIYSSLFVHGILQQAPKTTAKRISFADLKPSPIEENPHCKRYHIPQQASNADAFNRIFNIGCIVVQDLGFPSVQLLSTGFPSDWNEFWERKVNGRTLAESATMVLERLGPTYVKFGQALSARGDILPKHLAEALSRLQDGMMPFDSKIAKSIVRRELNATQNITAHDLNYLMQSMSTEPVAAASVGQVYKANLPGYGNVAIKVKRPGVDHMIMEDAKMIRSIARILESLPGLPGNKKLISTRLVNSVDEFMSRLFEELDYRNEVNNMVAFANLYSFRNGTSKKVKVIVPEAIFHLCTDNVIVMEWIDGRKLTDIDMSDTETLEESLSLIEQGIECTLSQLLHTGLMHADPHLGNILMIPTENGVLLGYLDFGILSSIPDGVRDGLICAVAQIVFAQNFAAVAKLFAELQLLPMHVVTDPKKCASLAAALSKTLQSCLIFESLTVGSSPVPRLRFDRLLFSLSSLVAEFEFQLPPYFLNNARALATLEGAARKLDPSFNVMSILYPYALDCLIRNPANSKIVDDTLLDLIRSPITQRVDPKRVGKLLNDIADLTARSKKQILLDIMFSKGSSRLARAIFLDLILRKGVRNHQNRERADMLGYTNSFRL